MKKILLIGLFVLLLPTLAACTPQSTTTLDDDVLEVSDAQDEYDSDFDEVEESLDEEALETDDQEDLEVEVINYDEE